MTIVMPLDQLNEKTAAFAEAMLVIRGRLIEAAIVMAHCQVAFVYPSKMRCLWPETLVEAAERKTEKKKAAFCYVPNAKALSRAEEVTYLFLPLITNDDDRKLVSSWASCIALPRRVGSFTQYCKRHGIVKRTCERKLQTIMIKLTSVIIAKQPVIACPDWNILPSFGQRHATKTLTRSYWRADDACPTNHPELHHSATKNSELHQQQS